jgi:hypothetical protein
MKRTIIGAILLLAGASSITAQMNSYSSAFRFVNLVCAPGGNLIANPFATTNSTINALLNNADGGDGVLRGARLVADLDGKAQPAHPDLVDAQLPVIRLALLVVHRIGRQNLLGGKCAHGDESFG